jgi:perosamine synthetase
MYPRLELDITVKDLIGNLLSAFRPSKRTKIVTQIQSYWHTQKETLVTFSVRTAFDLLLQALNLPDGSEIIMSAINIAHMEEIVKKHHCIPVVIDIDVDTLAPSIAQLKEAISDQTQILIIAHLFGSIVPLVVCQA